MDKKKFVILVNSGAFLSISSWFCELTELIFVMIPYISSTGYPPKTQGIMGHVQVANERKNSLPNAKKRCLMHYHKRENETCDSYLNYVIHINDKNNLCLVVLCACRLLIQLCERRESILSVPL